MFAIAELTDYVSPIQLGVGIQGGREHIPDDHHNFRLYQCFNSLHHDVMLAAVDDCFPAIYKFCHLITHQFLNVTTII